VSYTTQCAIFTCARKLNQK